MTTLIRLFAIGLLALVAVTWKLWTPQDVFPQVPLIQSARDWPGWLDWSCLAILTTSGVALMLFANWIWIRRISAAGVAGAFAVLFTLDQHRLQPWAWQFFLLAIVLCLADDSVARRLWMGLVVSIYFWSAVSKLDYTFCHVQGPALLRAFRSAIGLHAIPNVWTDTADVLGSFAIAAGELIVAILLLWRPIRPLGLWASTGMHTALLVALGPLGLRHSYGVLLWNVVFVIQNWLLFGRNWPELVAGSSRVTLPPGIRNRMAVATIAAAMVWPALEPFGLCDHWLAWAVYSARPGTVRIAADRRWDPLIHSIPVTKQLRNNPFLKDLDVTQWSLTELGVPVYPEHRFYVGIVWRLKELGFEGIVVLDDPPDRMTGARTNNRRIHVGMYDPGQLEELTKSFRWNVRPRRKQ